MSASTRPIRIGNGKDTGWQPDIVVREWAVSRRHCEVVPISGTSGWQYRLTDLGSLNGTVYKSQRVPSNASILLQEGDTFWIGATELACRNGSIAHAAETATAPKLRHAIPSGLPLEIGRMPDPGGIVVSMPYASRKHCQVERTPKGYRLTDQGSRNGTFFRGRRLGPKESVLLADGDVFEIEGMQFRVVAGCVEMLAPVIEATAEGVALDVRGVSVGNPPRLWPVSFQLPPGKLLAVVGTSGSGKSTLLKALVGILRPTRGRVLVNGADVHASLAVLSASMGYVPQKDTVHRELRVHSVLRYGAEMRMPQATSDQREEQVARVLRHLLMEEHADKPVHVLSGGQLKRVNVGLELLTRPALLYMDEPTSGLDPGLEKEFMEKMRCLAEEGCSVILVTHSELVVRECDLVLVLLPGGHTRYFGETCPQALREAFGTSEFATICQGLLREQPVPPAPLPADEASAIQARDTPVPPQVKKGLGQYRMLLRRYWEMLISGTVDLPVLTGHVRVPALGISLFAQAVLLPLILAAVLPHDVLSPFAQLVHRLSLNYPNTGVLSGGSILQVAETVKSDLMNKMQALMLQPILALLLVIFASMFGILSTANEITKEKAIFLRERMAGLQVGPYLLSKATVWSGLCLVHSALLLWIMDRRVHFDQVGTSWNQLLPTLALGSIAVMAIGLLISAEAGSSYQSIAAAGAVLFLLIMFSGVLPPGNSGIFTVPLHAVSQMCPSYWAFGALKTALNLPGGAPIPLARLWLVLLGALYLLGARWALLRAGRVA